MALVSVSSEGKLTIVQGDPGEGKTSFVLAVIAALTRGKLCQRASKHWNR